MLLLDEPFGALDAKVRQELRQWIRRLHEEIQVTSVFVTHGQEEAFEVADHVVVMNNGRVEQAGTPADVFERPANAFVMDFLGNVNVFNGRVERGRALVPGSDKGPFAAKTFADHLRAAWQALGRTAAPGVAFEQFWEDALRRGGTWSEVPAAKVALQPGLQVSAAGAALSGPGDGPALLVVPSARYYDGRGANKPWLHETPDPITQVVYDAWVEVAAVKDFPGGWAEYRVHEGGLMQVFHRISTPDALVWSEKTRHMFGGLYFDYAFGELGDRCFVVPAHRPG